MTTLWISLSDCIVHYIKIVTHDARCNMKISTVHVENSLLYIYASIETKGLPLRIGENDAFKIVIISCIGFDFFENKKQTIKISITF